MVDAEEFDDAVVHESVAGCFVFVEEDEFASYFEGAVCFFDEFFPVFLWDFFEREGDDCEVYAIVFCSFDFV